MGKKGEETRGRIKALLLVSLSTAERKGSECAYITPGDHAGALGLSPQSMGAHISVLMKHDPDLIISHHSESAGRSTIRVRRRKAYK